MDNHPLGDGFGERMRTERRRLGLTQEALAERVGVRQQTVLQYEKGSTSPTLQFVYALQEVGFNMQYLLYGREQVPLPRDFPPQVLRFVSQTVTEIEKKFAGGSLSNETRLRMMLVLLGQYMEEPATMPLTEAEALTLLVGR